jgi:transcriptional regulator with XRE-family HTH domain
MESGHNAERYVRQALISSIEGGHANPTLESLDKVASALDVAVADLLA